MEICGSTSEKNPKPTPEQNALSRVLKHRNTLIDVNPLNDNLFDQALRATLTCLITDIPCAPGKGSASGLRYLRDRISVPRDMPLLAARKFRQALEKTAQMDGPQQGPAIETQNRFDQNPEPFVKSNVQI